MMDGRVGAIRAALDGDGLSGTSIMAYSAKYASAFYGPFRDAAGSAPPRATGAATRWIPPTAARPSARCCSTWTRAPTWSWSSRRCPYLDVLAEVRRATLAPIAAYQVSGEYAMIKAAAAAGWLDERAAALEALTAIKRAGADMVITYWAGYVAEWQR